MQNQPWWEAGFLKALAETGVISEAARAVGIGVRAASKRRRGNPTFAAAWEAAIELHRSEQGRAALSAARELASDGHGGGKLVRAGQSRWSKRGEEAFLTELAVSANVRRAADAAGFSPACLYIQRRKNPHFAEAWDAAVAAGRARLEAFLVEAADRSFDPESLTYDADLPKMSVAEAIKVLQLGERKKGASPKGEPSGRGWIGPESWDDPDDEEAVAQARENIISRIERMRERDEEEKLAGGWTRDGENWVPPGYAPLVNVRALPELDREEQDQGPPALGL
jgi:hypothetical protein